jgi:hypothetical protein
MSPGTSGGFPVPDVRALQAATFPSLFLWIITYVFYCHQKYPQNTKESSSDLEASSGQDGKEAACKTASTQKVLQLPVPVGHLYTRTRELYGTPLPSSPHFSRMRSLHK